MGKEEKKEIKKIYEFNQDAKNIFTRYFSNSHNIVVGESTLTFGEHFIINGYYFQNGFNLVQSYNPKDIYDIMKNNKKNIESVSADMSSKQPTAIYFDAPDVKERFNIGYLISPSVLNSRIEEKFRKANEYITLLSSSDHEYITMGQEGATKLVENGIIDLDAGDYKTRISRQLIPGLKKKDFLYATFLDTDDKKLFKLVLKTERQTSKCTSYHIYTAIHI